MMRFFLFENAEIAKVREEHKGIFFMKRAFLLYYLSLDNSNRHPSPFFPPIQIHDTVFSRLFSFFKGGVLFLPVVCETPEAPTPGGALPPPSLPQVPIKTGDFPPFSFKEKETSSKNSIREMEGREGGRKLKRCSGGKGSGGGKK